ncbi:SRPBCC family protein [Bailinhaonella thermotolerans]|uniref:SRPBCC family protein n=1 Tax=Bailinhaonella thermotolerans TaxID=1070861 RepID=A0A3A3ZYZ5_9ACTN|nr:SRPBCC family protein [Bailinhaonella thermotolerans]RJL20818.1 SRPBCC family protein [Bailinhaonella thermotolerans]
MPTSYASSVLPATADEVWRYLRDFGNFAEWHPAIETCAIESGDPAKPGCVRRLVGPDGSVFLERLAELDDEERVQAYDFVESPFPVRDFHATLRVAPVTETEEAFVEWRATFEAAPADALKMQKIFSRGVFGVGLRELRKRYPGPGDPEDRDAR